MQSFVILIDRISAFAGKSFAWCAVILAAAAGCEVVSRHFLGGNTSWAHDAGYMLYGGVLIMTGAYTLSRNGHVRADFLYRLLRPRVQAGLDLALYLLLFFPGVVAFLVAGYNFAELSWQAKEHSTFGPAAPPIYHFKTLIPIAGFLVLLQGLAESTRCVLCLRTGRWPQRLRDVEELEKQILARRDARAGLLSDGAPLDRPRDGRGRR